jgi:nicotinamidase-related amidase
MISARAARLPCQHGDEIVPVVNQLAQNFTNVVLTQDWHPPGHLSFASSHPGRSPYETITVTYDHRYFGPTTACKQQQVRHFMPRCGLLMPV